MLQVVTFYLLQTRTSKQQVFRVIKVSRYVVSAQCVLQVRVVHGAPVALLLDDGNVKVIALTTNHRRNE